jgi:hypothetical protein
LVFGDDDISNRTPLDAKVLGDDSFDSVDRVGDCLGFPLSLEATFTFVSVEDKSPAE